MARSKVYKSKPKPVEKELPSDDEIDAFDKQKDFISLDAARESESDDVQDEGLYDLSDDADDSSEDEFDSDDSDAAGGTLGRLKRTEKAMRNKLSVQQGEEGDEEDGEVDHMAKDKQWGKSKRGYYGADTEEYELTDDEEALKDEEEEAQRLQRQAAEQLQPEDFEQEEHGLEASSSSDDEADTMGAKARQANGVASSGVQAPTVERLERDERAMTDEQRMSAVMADAPELAALLSELQGSLAEVRSHVGPVLKEVRGGNLATAEGVSYLEAKHLLLLHYCINIVFYLLLKAEGRPVRDHPVIARLLELRAYLEKIRPIDKKLQYQMDKLLMAAQLQISGKDQEVAADGTAAASDPLRFGPKPDQLIPKLAQDTQAAEGGVYRPPKLNPVSMDNDPDKDYGKKERRRQEHAARKAGRSDFVQALASELEGAPEELRASSAVAGNETLEALRHRQRLEARAAEEEDLMMDNGGAAGLDDRFLGNQLSQKFGADLLTQQKGKLRSGDDDLSAKLPLSQKRAKYDGVKAKQSAKTNAFGSDDDGEQPKKRVREEDDFYKESKALAEGKKKSKKGKYTPPDTLPPRPDPTIEGARAITTDIEKNRGLTPHRSKATKNPRKHNRNKFEKATMRRKGQVQEARTGSAGGYGGEQTGIKAGVTRGVRF
ncbi:MAG: hypothetical protein FRX49_01420 [Trebouxia sp. A1-2]|nr:MAG: hypothetical protein FRX49_01420 [Trebouxia sp. A1-2]